MAWLSPLVYLAYMLAWRTRVSPTLPRRSQTDPTRAPPHTTASRGPGSYVAYPPPTDDQGRASHAAPALPYNDSYMAPAPPLPGQEHQCVMNYDTLH